MIIMERNYLNVLEALKPNRKLCLEYFNLSSQALHSHMLSPKGSRIVGFCLGVKVRGSQPSVQWDSWAVSYVMLEQ